jgi:hypothetical protein
MGRTLIAALIAASCLVPSLTLAQTSAGSLPGVARGTPSGPSGGSFGVTIRQDSPPPQPPPPSQPAPPGAAGQITPPAPPSALDSFDLFRASPRTYAPRFDRSSRRNRFYGRGVGVGYITDPFGYISQPDSSLTPLDRYMRVRDAAGYVRIEVEPDTAQVYVDGLYAGTAGDFRRGGRALDVGLHRIAIRADGFEPLNVEVRVRANELISYRGTLRREQRAELRPPGPAKTFYVIPRCYAGDSRPRAEQLPLGCSIDDLRTIPPVVASSGRQ